MSPTKVIQKSENKCKRKVLSINDKLKIINYTQNVSRSTLISEYKVGSFTHYKICTIIQRNRQWNDNTVNSFNITRSNSTFLFILSQE